MQDTQEAGTTKSSMSNPRPHASFIRLVLAFEFDRLNLNMTYRRSRDSTSEVERGHHMHEKYMLSTKRKKEYVHCKMSGGQYG